MTPDDRRHAVIHTPDGLPGFDDTRTWELERAADDAVFGLLRSIDRPGVGLFVTEPWGLAPGYEPDLPEDELARIGVTDAGDLSVLVVATIAPDSATVWLNLAAPITVNTRSLQARQVILDRQGWPLRHPVSVQG